MKKILLLLVLLSSLLLGPAWAMSTFVVRAIDIQGLQRLSPDTVKSYLAIKRGETLGPTKTAQTISRLYKTGFFDRITLSRQGNTLVIHVVERPTIGQMKIKGNNIIPTDKLTTVMKSVDVWEGRIYSAAMLDKIKQSLLNQYYQLGRYNARVDISVTPMSRNRVQVRIDISEGLVAKVQKISIIGNHVFDEDTLVKQLSDTITTPGLFTFFTQKDRYAEEKLEAALEQLRHYYLDHGYLRFTIKSAQAKITPDRKSVYITIVVEEGALYTVQGYRLSGQLPMPREELAKKINIQPGDTFSRKKVVDAQKTISDTLGEKGYVFAAVTVQPTLNETKKEVFLTFAIKPGRRAYVRHISFSDHTRTNDVALRREIVQMEAAPISTKQLDESKHRLVLLPFIKDVEMAIQPVADSADQVDVNYKVKEDNSAQASLKLGYSQRERLLLGAGFIQKNFMGTGNSLGVDFTRSRYQQNYGVEYTDPFYTDDGISRTLSFAVSRVDPQGIEGLNNSYTLNEYNLGVLYGIPMGQEQGVFNRLYAGAYYQNTLIHLLRTSLSNQVNTFVTNHGRQFQELNIKLGASRDSRDKAIFTTDGAIQSFFLNGYAPIGKNALSFYNMSYQGKWYHPLTVSRNFILTARGDLGYGNGLRGPNDYPFFRNFYAGGIDSVRGYEAASIGPRDSNNRSFGGNILVNGSLGLIFPNYVSDNLRTLVFLDAGNVYSTANNRKYGGFSTGSGPIRYTTGVGLVWLTPLGAPIEISVAKALNPRPGDSRKGFDFSLGANFS